MPTYGPRGRPLSRLAGSNLDARAVVYEIQLGVVANRYLDERA